MRKTITVRLPNELADWLARTAKKTGVPQGQIVRQELEKAQNSEAQPFMRLAGKISGPPDLSTRKGFSRE
jgi:hypothetical protein